MKHPSVPYVAPMAVFLLLLAAGRHLGLGEWEFPFRVFVLAGVLWAVSRHVIDLRARLWPASLFIGAAVFVIWIGPDWLWPAYRSHWLFQNPVTGNAESSLPADFRMSALVLVFRTIRAVVIVPIVEELFWRGWLMRWLINQDFQKVPLGTWAARSFWITAGLFAVEHGAYWEVGLVAGLIYNAWMIRSKSLGDCILAHAVTNALLSGYVITAGKWEYWL